MKNERKIKLSNLGVAICLPLPLLDGEDIWDLEETPSPSFLNIPEKSVTCGTPELLPAAPANALLGGLLPASFCCSEYYQASLDELATESGKGKYKASWFGNQNQVRIQRANFSSILTDLKAL